MRRSAGAALAWRARLQRCGLELQGTLRRPARHELRQVEPAGRVCPQPLQGLCQELRRVWAQHESSAVAVAQDDATAKTGVQAAAAQGPHPRRGLPADTAQGSVEATQALRQAADDLADDRNTMLTGVNRPTPAPQPTNSPALVQAFQRREENNKLTPFF